MTTCPPVSLRLTQPILDRVAAVALNATTTPACVLRSAIAAGLDSDRLETIIAADRPSKRTAASGDQPEDSLVTELWRLERRRVRLDNRRQRIVAELVTKDPRFIEAIKSIGSSTS